MYEGHSFQLSQVLPRGVRVDDVYIGLAALAAFLCVVAVGNSLRLTPNMSPQIKALQERRRELQNATLGPKKRRRPETSVNFMRAVVTKLQLLKKSQTGKSESMLVEAGWRSKDAIYIVLFFTLVTPIVLAIAIFTWLKIYTNPNSELHVFVYLWPVVGAYIGLKLPWAVVKRRRKKRYLFIQRSLADMLDLMTICAEAGLSLAASLERVSRELRMAYREMSEELSLTAIEMSFLPDRNKALLNLAERVQLPEVRGIVSVLVQTEKYGTPIAQALRVLSVEFRDARMMRAEEKAARLPALMTVPMILFILPTLFIVIIAPAAVKVMDTVR